MSEPPRVELPRADRPQHCYGCRHLTSRYYGDGTTSYGCDLSPGLVTGSVSAFEDDDPRSCESYQR